MSDPTPEADVEEFESALPDLSDVDIDDIDDIDTVNDSALSVTVAQLNAEVERPEETVAGFSSSL